LFCGWSGTITGKESIGESRARSEYL